VNITLGWNKALWWNNGPVSWSEFQNFLNASAKEKESHIAFWVLEPTSVAECKDVSEVRRAMETALACSKGWCGEGRGDWVH
jgi:hypothetical protein